MANPQKENGSVGIANQLFEAMYKFQFTGLRDLQIVLFVMRKTYGYNKKSDWVALSQFVDETGFDRTSVCRILKRLMGQMVLMRVGRDIAVQKDWEKWGIVARTPLAPKPLAHKPTGSGPQVNQLVAPKPHTKYNLQKTLIQKTIEPIKNPSVSPTVRVRTSPEPIGKTLNAVRRDLESKNILKPKGT